MKKYFRHSYLVFIAMLIFFTGELDIEEIVDTAAMVLLIASIILFFFTQKNTLFTIFFNFILIWFSIGNINYLIFRLIWFGWESDIVSYNLIFSLFVLVFSLLGFIFNSKITIRKDVSVILVDFNVKFFIKCSIILIIFYALLFLPKVGWTGVFSGTVVHSNRFDIEFSPLLSRLSLAIPLLGCIIIYLVIEKFIYPVWVIVFFVVAFYLQAVGGARFSFFISLMSMFFLLFYSRHIDLIKKFRVPIALSLMVFIISYQIIATIRDEQNISDFAGDTVSVLSVLDGFGGEHRDAAASFELFGPQEKNIISSNYLSTIAVTIFPGPLLSFFGIQKDMVVKKGAAYLMQEEYKVVDGSIRIGGIAEAYFWRGILGILIASMVIYFTIYQIDRLTNEREIMLSRLILISYGSPWIFYFVASQSDMLIGGFVGMVVNYYVLKYFQIFFGLKNQSFYVNDLRVRK